MMEKIKFNAPVIVPELIAGNSDNVLKGFRYSNLVKSQADNSLTITLINEDNLIIDYAVGDTISITSQAQTFYNCASITNITENIIQCTYAELDDFAHIPDATAVTETNFNIFCVNKTNTGYVISKGGIALGDNTKAYGFPSISIGPSNFSAGRGSTAIGRWCVSTNNGSVALGNQCESTGSSSISLGYKSIAKTTASMAAGFNSITESTGAAIGNYCIAKRDAPTKPQIVVGQYNAESLNSIFIVGNGESGNSRSNALEININGYMTTYNGATFGGSTITQGSANVTEKLVVDDWVTFKSGLTVGSGVEVGGLINCVGDVTTSGKLTANQWSNFNSGVTVKSNLVVGGVAQVTGDISTAGKITVDKWSTFKGGLTVNSNTVIDKVLQVGQDLNVTGRIIGSSSARFNSNVSIGGTLALGSSSFGTSAPTRVLSDGELFFVYEEKYNIDAGTWRWNDNFIYEDLNNNWSDGFSQLISFSSGGNNYNEMSWSGGGLFYDNTFVWSGAFSDGNLGLAAQTIQITKAQDVSKEFYDVFTSCTTKIL